MDDFELYRWQENMLQLCLEGTSLSKAWRSVVDTEQITRLTSSFFSFLEPLYSCTAGRTFPLQALQSFAIGPLLFTVFSSPKDCFTSVAAGTSHQKGEKREEHRRHCFGVGSGLAALAEPFEEGDVAME
jgi:hypothetical protein